jgi:hypothetical protein
MKLATSKELFSYWCSLRAERAAPERSDIDPSAIRNVLADTFILELADDRPFRVSGARIGAIFGRELKGDSFLSLWRPEDHLAVDRLIFESAESLKPALAVAQAAPRGRVRVELEILLLPLRHYGRTRARMLGALSPNAVPTWLGLLAAEPMTLVEARFLHSADELAVRADAPADVQVRPAPSSDSEPLRRRHLFVYEGGRLQPGELRKEPEVYWRK